jgi:hypothetical protein
MGSGALPSMYGLKPQFVEEGYKVPEYWGQFGSDHPGVVMFGFGDGSIRALPLTVDFLPYAYMSANADGNVIDAGSY